MNNTQKSKEKITDFSSRLLFRFGMAEHDWSGYIRFNHTSILAGKGVLSLPNF